MIDPTPDARQGSEARGVDALAWPSQARRPTLRPSRTSAPSGSSLRRTGPESEDHDMQIVAGQITVADLAAMAEATFGDLVKAVVDVRRGLLAVDAGMHSDLEALLLDAGSRQGDLWGVNLYPAEFGAEGFLEFDSMINLRPGRGNRTRSVDDPDVRAAIEELVGRVVVP
jgi:Protein of unknown function (DUF5674)